VNRVRTLAFYLPQFHPIPENDEWWGPGFTEWTNVAKARPLYPGHYQPHLPGELGFYDLRLPEARQAQADLAREHGIDGFVYYHYWFNGRRLLERPFNDVLSSGQPDFPFALCWANENWTRVWDGGDSEILMPQEHSEDDDRRHLQWLAAAFADPRCVRVDGKPMFLVYRATELTDPRRTAQTWREEARRLGLGELHLVRVESFGSERVGAPEDIGFDAAVEWIPDWITLKHPLHRTFPEKVLRRLHLAPQVWREQSVFDYDDVVDQMLEERSGTPPYVRYPCVTPAWDNSPRKARRAVIFDRSTPETYARWLDHAVRREQAADREGLVFISAWNEWAEGNHLEPDVRWGRAYLEATREVLRDS
jgi:lipopolysaccharide biosynthesis protein